MLKTAQDATLRILADLWPETYLFIESVANERIYADRAGAMMFLGDYLGRQAQISRSVKAIEGEQFAKDLEIVSHFLDNASHVDLQLRDTHIDKRPRIRSIVSLPVANRFVARANAKHGAKLSSHHLKDLEEFHHLILKEADSRNVKIGWTDHNYPPPNAASAPLRQASKFSIFDLPKIKP